MSVAVLNTDASLTGKTLMAKEVSETITGVKTFDLDPSAPFAVSSGSAVVTNLDADKVDGADYSVGTFTPIFTSAGGGAPTYTTQIGTYTRLGSRVWFDGSIVLATIGTLGAGQLSVSGLPFTVGATYQGGVHVSYWANLSTAAVYVAGICQPNTIKFDLVFATGATATLATMAKADIVVGTTNLIFHGSYVAV